MTTTIEATRTYVDLAFADVLCNLIELIGTLWAKNEPTRLIELGINVIKPELFSAFVPLFEVLAENA